jgi:hypothetical protein
MSGMEWGLIQELKIGQTSRDQLRCDGDAMPLAEQCA